jgi:hypothetical protein
MTYSSRFSEFVLLAGRLTPNDHLLSMSMVLVSGAGFSTAFAERSNGTRRGQTGTAAAIIFHK